MDDPTAVQKALLEVLASQDWENVLAELMTYTLGRLQNRYWLGVWSGHLPGGKEARDLVMESVADVISGLRRCDADVDVIAFLKQVIRSKISHLVWSAENRRTTRMDHPDPAAGELDKAVAEQKPQSHFSDEQVISRETEEINGRLLGLMIDHVSDDQDLQKVIECNLDGIFKREEIAERLGRSVSEITNIKKRLDRRMIEFRKKYENENPFQA